MSKNRHASHGNEIYFANSDSNSAHYRKEICKQWLQKSSASQPRHRQKKTFNDNFPVDITTDQNQYLIQSVRKSTKNEKSDRNEMIPFDFDVVNNDDLERNKFDQPTKKTEKKKNNNKTVEPYCNTVSGNILGAKSTADFFSNNFFGDNTYALKRERDQTNPIIYNIKCKNLVIKSDCDCRKKKPM